MTLQNTLAPTLTRRVPTKLERKVLRDLRYFDQAALSDDPFHGVPRPKDPRHATRQGSFDSPSLVERLAHETRQPARRVQKQVAAFLETLMAEGVVTRWGRGTIYSINRDRLAELHPIPQQETR